MNEKKLALPYLARAEQQALKVGIFITKKLQIFDVCVYSTLRPSSQSTPMGKQNRGDKVW